MSLKSNEPSFFGNALIGACCAIGTSVPISAYIADFLGNTYLVRVFVYGLILLWVICGAIAIFFKTYKAERKKLSIKFIALWFLSVWLWPLLLFLGKNRE